MKNKRQEEIIRIVSERAIGTHEELMEELKARGFKVTQATVSRDIKALRIVKTPSENGSVYSLPQRRAVSDNPVFNKSVKSVRRALHTVVIRTQPGMAGGIGAAADSEWGNMMLGTIAGDDTVLVIAESEDAARLLSEKISDYFDCGGK